MERSASTIPQAYMLFAPNMYGLATLILTWGAKVFVAVVNADTVMAETNWKHKITPNQGDLLEIAH